MRPALPYYVGYILLCTTEAVHQRLIPLRFFDRIQIRTLYILDDRNFEDLNVIELTDDRGYCVQTRLLRGTPATLARNDLVAPGRVRQRTDQDGLQHTVR